ncbi:MAG: extracellular solute-binding protein [Lachnospiraceae bacterium]|nr:extracellular solute-binding protein [Lachnospiraceae bacterium]
MMRTQIKGKIATIFIMIFIAAIMIAGCGKKEEESTRKDFYYLPEYRELPIEANYIADLAEADDVVYMMTNSWDEETYETSTDLYAYHPMDEQCDKVALPIPQECSVQSMYVNDMGNLILSVGRYEENAETGEYKEYRELWEVSPSDGNILNTKDITDAFSAAEYFYPQYCVADSKGTIYTSDGSENIFVIDKEGTLVAQIALDDWIEDLFVDKNDNAYIKKWTSEGARIIPVDVNAKKLGDPVTAANITREGNSYNQKHYKGTDTDLIISDNTGVYTYDFATDSAVDVFEWLDADMNCDSVQEMGLLSDGRYWVMLQDYTGEKPEYSFALLTKTPASEVPVKEELTFATMYLSQDMRRSIIEFNKTNEQYRILVKEYQSDDYNAAITQFNNDITGGNCPDIVNMTGLDFERYASKGVLEDLYPFMEKDGIKKQDYLENVLTAYEKDGKLYGIIPQFAINSAVIKTANAKGQTGWTLDEMLTIAEESGVQDVFNYGSQSGAFRFCVFYNINEFINWKTGECFFNSEEFMKVLEFAAKLPKEPDYEAESVGLSERIRNDKLLLLENGISSVQEYQMLHTMFGEDITFIGYPNSERKGNLIRSTNTDIAITSKSDNKEAAWEFVKVFLSDEYQEGLVSEHGGWGFPIKRSALEKQFELDMTPNYYEDESGNQTESPKTSWGYDDFQAEIYAAKQEDIDAVMEVLTSAERPAGSVNEEIMTIITEETEAFFGGQKSAKETADIIQNRVKIYVSENS